MRKSYMSVVCFVALASMVLFVAVAADPPETIVIDDCQAKQSAVDFPHKAHIDQGVECSTCHHTQADLTAGSDITVETCGSCHNEPAEATTPKCSEMSTSKNPYHKNCISCHKDEAKKNEATTAPTKCFDCHPKG